jgi:hypothetical protein
LEAERFPEHFPQKLQTFVIGEMQQGRNPGRRLDIFVGLAGMF